MPPSDNRNRRSLIKTIGYAGFALFSLLLSLYLTFPVEALRDRLSQEVSTRSANTIALDISDLSLLGPTGISGKDIDLTFRGHQPKNSTDGRPLQLHLDELNTRVEILPLLSGTATLDTSARLGDGTIVVDATPRDARNLDARVSILGVELAHDALLLGALGVPIRGLLNGNGNLSWRGEASKSDMDLSLSTGGLSIGPAVVAGFSLPKINGGNVSLELAAKEGQLQIVSFKQRGGDVKLVLNGSISLRRRIEQSALDLCVKVKAEGDFLEANPKFKSALELAQIRFKRDGDGYLNINIGGNATRPRVRGGLCRAAPRTRKS